MKMKKIATKFSAIALMALALTSCNKKANVAPEADKEFQSAIDASAATQIVSDIDMLVAQASEYSYVAFYTNINGAGSNTVTVKRDTAANMNTIIYNNAKCLDGAVRNGTITIDYTKCSTGTVTSGGQQYIRNPNHMAVVSFNNYSVNKYVVHNASSITVKNTTPAGYTRTITPLTWNIAGTLILADTTDNGGNKNDDIKWVGNLNKTLVNSTTSSSIHPSSLLPIRWITGLYGVQTGTANTSNNAVNPNGINAIVKYSGSATGFTTKDGAQSTYSFSILDGKELYRNFGCSPDYYINPEQHPIRKGVVEFKTGDKAVRTIYYGDEKNNDYCDNSGIIYINGISYTVDFWK